MEDNTIKSTDINKEEKKPAAKKTATKKAAKPKISDAAPAGVKNGYKVVVFESGTAYTFQEYRFTQQDRIQEVPEELAEVLLTIENFRLPDPFEIEEYLNNREE